METINPPTSKKTNKNLGSHFTIIIKSLPLPISPQKMSLITNYIKGWKLGDLLNFLPFSSSKGGRKISELLQKEVKY